MCVLDTISCIASSMAVLISIFQFSAIRNRERKRDTLMAFDELERNEDIKKLFEIDSVSSVDLEVEMCTRALAALEHFSAGVNTGVYNYRIVNRLAGNKLISIYELIKCVICKKRLGKRKANNYTEFEYLIKILEIHRKSRFPFWGTLAVLRIKAKRNIDKYDEIMKKYLGE